MGMHPNPPVRRVPTIRRSRPEPQPQPVYEEDANLEGGFASIGHELEDNAPLWRVYRDDVRSHDQSVTLDEWNKTLDVLLIFAGLFSAVVATLVVATIPLLNPQEDYVAIALYTLARSLDKDTTLSAPKPAGPAESSSLWINGLWFASLFLSLSVAFFAILAKQWLVEYNHRMADPPGDLRGDAAATPTASLTWARRRGYFFDGFNKWHVPALVTQILPLLLHVALFLFLVGLAVFIWTLNRPIARGMIAFTAVLFALYIISTILPVLRLDCPTATPLIRQAREVCLWLAYKAVELCAEWTSSSGVRDLEDGLHSRLINTRIASWDSERLSSDDLKAVRERTLKWLFLVSGSESAISLVFQSLGALHPDRDSTFIHSLRRMTAGMSAFDSLPVAPTAVEVVRAIRSELVLGRGSYSSPMLGLDLSAHMIEALKGSYWPDAKLLWASMNLYARSPASPSTPNDGQPAEHLSSIRTVVISHLSSRTSTSLHSTALLLLRSAGCPQSAVPYLVAISALEAGIKEEDRQRILRALRAAPPHDRQMRAAGEPHPRRAPPQLYQLLDETPLCDCAYRAGIICTALTFDDSRDFQIGGWIIRNCSRDCRCAKVTPEWHAIRQLFAHPLESENSWKYLGALLLTFLSLGDAAVHVLDHTSNYELDQILKFLFDLESRRLNAISGNAATPSDSEPRTLGPLPIIQILDLGIEAKTWAPLLGLIDSKLLEAISPFALAKLLAGVCYLRLRGREVDETLTVVYMERVMSSLITPLRELERQLQKSPTLSEAVEDLNLPVDASAALASLQQLLDSDRLTYADKVDILDWLTLPYWSTNRRDLPPTLDLEAFGKMTTLRGAVDESRPLREILWRHMTTRRLADESDDFIDVMITRRVINTVLRLGPLPAGGQESIPRTVAEKIVAAYTGTANPVDLRSPHARKAASSPSTSTLPAPVHGKSKS